MSTDTITTIDISTARGTLRGEHGPALAFRGISYAQPPVGALRFAAPEPVVPWTGVREALWFGPAVPQSAASRRNSSVPPDVTHTDDYLTLNVWTPELTGARPVMVWIHGGAYLGGATTNPVFDGTRLAVEGDVVVVTVNHRVSVEGYAEIEGAPANRGLLDVVAALRWVRENIATFGGDPGAVTIFGQSAGAGAVASLLVMPSAQGLFHRAIAQSVPGTYLSRRLAREVTWAIADEAGVAPTVAGLGQVEPAALAEIADAVRSRMAGHRDRWGVLAETDTPFAPVLDGVVLQSDAWSGQVSDVPVLVGHTRDEFRTFAAARVAAHGPVTDDDASAAVARFGPAGGRAGYEELLAAEGLPIDAATVFETVNADWLFRMPSARLAAVRAAAGAPTHLFEFAHSVPKLDAAPHGGENPLIFGNFAGGTAERFYVAPASAGTEALGTYLRGIWAAFAHTGDPGWAPYTEHDGGAMVFDTASSRRPYPHARTLAAYSATPPAALDVVGD